MRRSLSIFFYIVAGMVLMSEATMIFATLDPQLGKLTFVAVMAPFVLIPLGLGAWASPGARLREVGIVLLAATGWAALMVGMVVYVTAMPDTRPFMPPGASDMFTDYAAGLANLIVLAGLGLLLLLHGRRSRPD